MTKLKYISVVQNGEELRKSALEVFHRMHKELQVLLKDKIEHEWHTAYYQLLRVTKCEDDNLIYVSITKHAHCASYNIHYFVKKEKNAKTSRKTFRRRKDIVEVVIQADYLYDPKAWSTLPVKIELSALHEKEKHEEKYAKAAQKAEAEERREFYRLREQFTGQVYDPNEDVAWDYYPEEEDTIC